MAKFATDGADAMSTDLQMGKVSSVNDHLDVSDDQDVLKSRDPFSTFLDLMSLSVLASVSLTVGIPPSAVPAPYFHHMTEIGFPM